MRARNAFTCAVAILVPLRGSPLAAQQLPAGDGDTAGKEALEDLESSIGNGSLVGSPAVPMWPGCTVGSISAKSSNIL